MCSCDVDLSTVWDERRVVARKRHACEECDHPIGAGEPYVRVGSLFDGSWSTHRFCLFCREFSEQARLAGVCAEIGRLYTCALEWAEGEPWPTFEERNLIRGLCRSAVEGGVA